MKNVNKNSSNKNKIFNKLVIVLLIIVVLLGTFITFDFMTFNHIKKGTKVKKEKVNNIFNIKVKGNDNFVFLGDSLTEYYSLKEYYENLPVINSGVGGNTTNDILDDLEDRVYKYNPSKVFLLIGINDMKKGRDEEYILNNIVKIVNEIKKNRPHAKIYVESLYPINNSDNEKINHESLVNRTNEKIDNVNRMLKEKYENTNVTYIDINSKMKENGILKLDYTVEGVHITPLGYINITRLLLPYLAE